MITIANNQIRYAVIGAGHIAQVAVLPAFAHATENSKLVALISSDAEKRAELTQRYGIELAGSYDELERIIERGHVDAVYVATPNTLHREYAVRAAKSGAHVLCEKPMATSVADCEAMIEACRQARVKLMIAYRLHFEEANLAAIELIRSGKLGKVKVFSSIFSQQVRGGNIRTRQDAGGGSLWDMGVYPINAVRYLFRSEPVEVFAVTVEGTDERFEGVDELATAILRFSDGRVAQICSGLSAASVSSYRVVGEKGDLRVEPAFDYKQGLTHHLTIEGETTERSFPKRDQFAPELVTFSRCILEDRQPEASGEEGLADVRIIEAIHRSAKTGRPVRLEPFERQQRPDMRQVFHKPPINRPPEPINAQPPGRLARARGRASAPRGRTCAAAYFVSASPLAAATPVWSQATSYGGARR